MTQENSGTGSREQRRYARQATLQAARIRFADGVAIPSEIRDFCANGLYVAFLGEGTPDAAIPALMGAPVQVEFAVGHSSLFHLNGRVAHVSPGGVGVFVSALPEGVSQALRNAGDRLVRPPAGSALGPQQVQALQQECVSQFQPFLETVMEEFFQHVVERMGEVGQNEPSFLERSRYEFGAQELTYHRSRIRDDFFNAMRNSLQQADVVTDASTRTLESKDKLELIDDAEFEDWLNLSAVITRIEAGVAPQLDEFEQRYSRLVGRPIGRKNNSFGPETIGRAFQHAIQVLDFSNPMRAVLYKTLGQAISIHAPALYQKLNQTLAALQPIAPIAPGSGKANAVARSERAAEAKLPANDRSKPGLPEIPDTLDSLYKQPQAGIPPGSESSEYTLDRILSTLNQSQQRVPAVDVHAARPGHQGVPPTEQAAAYPKILQVVNHLQQAARQLQAGVAHMPPPSPAQDGIGAALPEASLRELLVALDGVPIADQTGPDMPSLPSQIDARITSASGDPRRLALNHRQILEATSRLLLRARADAVPSSDIELLAKRLERPLLKLALQDADFPGMPDHPARQVLNLIEQFAVAADDRGKIFDAKLQRFLTLLVDRICSRADDDPGVFEAVRDSLERVLQPILQIRRTRVARLQEASEGRERIRAARDRVNTALEQRLAGRKVPAMLLRLLDAGWRQYLVLLALRQGAIGEAWDAGLAVLDRLSVWLDPAQGDAVRSPEAAKIMLSEIERALATVNVDTNLLSAFVAELDGTLARLPSSPDQGAAMVYVPPGRLAAAQGEDALTAQKQWGDRLRVGGWWDFNVDGSRIPMQLIWVSQPPLGCAFANRSATSKLDLTLTELSRRAQQGLAKPGRDMDTPLIERSEQALYDETYQSVMHQVMHDPVTSLLNRKGFMQRLNQLPMPEEEGKAHAVGIIEFDQFRMIYNICGVVAAEALARNLASVVQAQIGAGAILASFRDDTLAILLPNCSRVEGCDTVDILMKQIKDFHFQHEQHSYSIGFNIGMAEYAPGRISADEAIRHADSACITAKSLGRNRIQIYEQSSPQLQTQESMMDWAGRLDTYLSGNGLYLRCQQVMPVSTDRSMLPYFEILLGIENEAGGQVEPMHFIPTVERLQRAHELDIWVIRSVFDWISSNPSSFASVGGFAINLSATSLSSPEVIRCLHRMLPASNFPTDKIIFEITETAAIVSYGAAQDFIREIRRYGCKFALDDFGSGFTSYAHLKNLRTDSLKIDGSFVKEMLQNPGDYAMVKSMNDIGHSLGLRTVAEFVESPQILDALREIGVDYAQGYAVHKPCRIEEFAWPPRTG